MNRLLSLFKRNKEPKPITIVSGLPRSGTSLMMKMLESGGMTPFTDSIREADKDNPKGYYEFERVKKLGDGDNSWLPEAQGKVVKIISMLLFHLPKKYCYKIIFMHRNLKEVLASQRKMLIHRNKEEGKANDEEMEQMYTKHLRKVKIWINDQPNITCLEVNYNELFENPNHHTESINRFFEDTLNVENMKAAIDSSLYRNRG